MGAKIGERVTIQGVEMLEPDEKLNEKTGTRAAANAPAPAELTPKDGDEDKEDGNEDNERENEELQQALALSLQSQPSTPLRTPPVQTASCMAGENPLWLPSRYVPPERSAGRLTLNVRESIFVRDGGYQWQAAGCFLDTGNQHMTIIDSAFAAQHAIYAPHALGAPSSLFAQPERWTTLRGVVPGASSRAPVVTIAIRIRDESFTIQAAVSSLGGSEEVLLGADVIERLFASGYRLAAGSMR